MKNHKIPKAICIVLVAISCNNKNSKELNTIVFKDPIINVQDSIFKLNNLLKRLPTTLNGDFRNYEFANSSNTIQRDIQGDSILYINDNKINKQTIDTVRVLANYNLEEKNNIITLTTYLKDNYLWGAGFGSTGIGMWSYDYRGGCEHSFKDCRSIFALQVYLIRLKLSTVHSIKL